MKSGAYFRTATVGGFNKEVVLNYIDQMSERSKHNEAKLQKQIEELTAQRDSLQSVVGSGNPEEIRAMQNQIVKLKEALTSVSETKDKLESNFDKARTAVEKSIAQAQKEAEKAKQFEAKVIELTKEKEQLESDNKNAREELRNTRPAAQELQRRYNELKNSAASAPAAAAQSAVIERTDADNNRKYAELEARIKDKILKECNRLVNIM